MDPNSAGHPFTSTLSTLDAFLSDFHSPVPTLSTTSRTHLTSRTEISKRKWNTAINLALPNEFMVVGAHIPLRNELTQLFADLAKRLKNNDELQMSYGHRCKLL